jgi:O-antigen/teichoic acid export membrane protein
MWERAVQHRLLAPSARRRLSNVAHLFAGNLAGSTIGLVAFALTARALGTTDYGVLALIFAYCRAIERIVSFQSWQPLIKYGAALTGKEHHEELKSLMKFGLLLDIGGAVATYVVAVGVAIVAAHLLGWSTQTVDLLLIYATSLLFNASGMATAVLRLAGRFRLMAYSNVTSAAMRVAFCALGYWFGGGLFAFVLIWAGMQIWGSIIFIAFAFLELRRQGVVGLWKAPIKDVRTKFPGIWNFAWSSNLSLTIRSSAYEFDTLLVGALADPASAGLYHIAKRIGRLALQLGNQVQAVIYPDVARLWAQRAFEEFRNTVWQIDIVLAVFGLLAWFFFYLTAEPLLRFVAGPEFTAAATLLVVQMAAVTMTLTGAAMRSALMAMGYQRDVLSVVLASTVVFHATAIVAIPVIGAMGANVAHVVMGFVWLCGMTYCFRKALRAPRSESAPITAE